MAISGNQILMKLAQDLAMARGVRITGVTNSAYLSLALPTSSNDNEYQWAWANVFGKGITQVMSHLSTGSATVSPAFATLPVVGEVMGLALWNANQEYKAKEAINAFIDAAYPNWYREVRIDRNYTLQSDGTTTFAGITLDAEVDEYVLPSDVAMLSRIGIQPTALEGWKYEYPPMDLWRVLSDYQPKRIKFQHNGRMFIPQWYAGETLCLHYQAKEPLLTNMTSATCQIPLDLFSNAAAYFAKRELWRDSRTDLATDNVALPQLFQEAQAAWARIGSIKQPLAEGPEYGWRFA